MADSNMVILNVKLDNIFGFRNFEINFSYPKKIVNSIIPEEHLPGRPNFRYKKAMILMGANASGKTTLGKALFLIFEYLSKNQYPGIMSALGSDHTKASFSVDFVVDENTLYRVEGISDSRVVSFHTYSAEIQKNDSYEKTAVRLQPASASDVMSRLQYRFAYSDVSPTVTASELDQEHLLQVMKAVLGTLDPTLQDIAIAKDLKNSIIIRRKKEDIIIQDGKLLNREALSHGIVEGVDIALLLAAIMQENGRFYYCDEHFSFIQSDIEKRIFGIMLEHLGDYDQLIFTTHNMDLLDLNLPKHSYAFLRKKPDGTGDYKISVAYASDYLKRNTDSIRCAVENNVFSSLPDDSLLDQLDRGALK